MNKFTKPAKEGVQGEQVWVEFAVSNEDFELDAAIVAVSVLDTLEPAAARRVVSYLAERF